MVGQRRSFFFNNFHVYSDWIFFIAVVPAYWDIEMPSSPIYFSISSVASFSCVGKSTHRIKTDTRFGFPGLSCTNYVAVCMRPSQSINFLYVSNSEYRRCLQNGRHSIDTTQYCWRKRVIQWRKMPLLSFNSILLKRAQIYVPYCIVGALQWTRRWLSL